MIYDIFMSCLNLSRRDDVFHDTPSKDGDEGADEGSVFSSSKPKTFTKR